MSEKYDEIPMAGNIIKPGNATEYKTGGWRSKRPVHIAEKCLWVKNGTCGLCWIFCPDDAIRLEEKDGEYVHIYDYDYCKGCGICAEQCPVDAIKMEDE
jgi:pyruvate ferredoxin oxidoreductase delta subunit